VTLDLGPAAARFGALLGQRLDALTQDGDEHGWRDLLGLLQIGTRLGLEVPERPLQDRLFAFVHARLPGLLAGLHDAADPAYGLAAAVLAVAGRLNIRVDEFRKRLKPLEESFAKDPTYWP